LEDKLPFSIPDYTTIYRRVMALNIQIDDGKSIGIGNNNNEDGGDIIIAVDDTGIKVANRGEWLRHRWKVRRGYIKIHVAVDIKSKRILALDVTTEEVHTTRRLRKLVSSVLKHNKVKRVLADGAYDSKDNFKFLADNARTAIRVRRNSVIDGYYDHPRQYTVLEQHDYERWKSNVQYGYRWIAVESVFSSLKRMFSEHVMAKKYMNMVKELTLKVSLYNLFLNITSK
jgi:hypothetical protein